MSNFPTSMREDTGVKGFTQLIRPWNTYLVLIILLVGGLALTDMALPFALSLLIDDVFPSFTEKDTQARGWTSLSILLLSLCAIYVLRNVLFFISRMLCVKVSEEVSFNLRQRLFDHLQQLGMSFYKTNQPGQISSRVMDDTFRIQIFVQEKLPTLLRYTIEFLILMVLLYTVNWKLAVASTFVLPLHLWTYKKFYQPIRDSHHRAQKHLADAHGSIIETFLGAQVVKGFSAEQRESESFLKTIRAGRDTQIRTQRIQFSQKVIADLLVGAGTIFLIGYGAWEVSQGPTVMKVGAFLMFFWYVRMLYPAVLEIISGMGHFSKTSASVDRVFEMLDEPATEIIHDMRTRNKALHFDGSIVFANVSLVFDNQTDVLQNINLVIPEGQHLVITGPSGSGKSSLISLLPRFTKPTTGTISVGGIDISTIRLNDVRGMFSVAFQDAFLFNASIFENLRYARPDATPQEILEACQLTGASNFIQALPNGYETLLGNKGGELSHGQKQRINLARALVRKPQTLIIDETTASIEASKAVRIISDILEHMQGRTVIIVTHDTSIMRLVERVITLGNKTITSDKYVEKSNMKHPSIKSNITHLGTLLLCTFMFFGCSSTAKTTTMLQMEKPISSTGVIFEEDDPVDLVALADAMDAMLAKQATPITFAAPASIEPTEPPSPAEIVDLVETNNQVLCTSVLIELPRLNETELNEVVERLKNLYSLEHQYRAGKDSLDGVLPSSKKDVASLLTLTHKQGDTTKIIRFGLQEFISQPNQLWVEGYAINGGGEFFENPDATLATAYTTSLFSSLETMRSQLSVLDLEKKIIQLSYIDAPSAITMLNGLGITVFTNANEVPDEVNWNALPYVVQIPEPSGADTGLVGASAIKAGNFGLTMVPASAGQLSENTISSPLTQLMVFFDPARPESFSDVKRMITELVDRAARQIFIEGMVLEINEDGIKDIGINWHMLDANNPDLLDVRAGKDNAGAAGDTFNLTLIDVNLERAFTRFNEWWFDVDIRAMVRDGKAEILSRPSILTLNNRQATIRVGEDIPIATSTAGMSNADMLSFNFKYLPTGIMLNIRPRIAENGKEVSMMIDTIVSSAVPGADLTITDATSGITLASAPTIASRRVQTYGIIPNNTPFIIGGLVNKEHHTVQDKVPLLGDLPLIGGLFRANRTTTNKTEVIIVLTPHVLPSSTELLSAMPKDDPRFDDFGNELFRDSYRIRSEDVYDIAFIENNERLTVCREFVQAAVANNFRLATTPAYAPFAHGQFPGESILVTRMIYEIIKRFEVAKIIQPARLAFFESESSEGMNVQFLDVALAKSVNELSIEGFFRDTRDLAMAVVFEEGKDIPTVTTIPCPDRKTWRELVWELNQPSPTGAKRQAVVIQNEKDLTRLRIAVALKHFLELNNGSEALKLGNFQVGKYVLFPDLNPKQVHIIDADVAKYFFQTEHYYRATLQEIREATEALERSIQAFPLR